MSHWEKKTLVTGAGGFIGSHLCETLIDAGAEVTALIRYSSRQDWGNLEYLPPEKKSRLRVVAGNVEDAESLSSVVAGQDTVFHLAALIGIPYSYHAPRSTIQTNVEGALNVLEAARRHQVRRLVLTSTSEVYGTALYTPMDENHPLQAQSPYAASKIAADKLAESYHRSFGLPVSILRPFNTYGPRQSSRAVIPTIISQVLSGGPVRLGALDPVRDLNYVKDIAAAFLMIAECAEAVGRTIHVGSGIGTAIGDLARQILDLMGKRLDILTEKDRVRPAGSEVQCLLCDASVARKTLGWEPTLSLNQGLQETIEFVSRNRDLYRAGSYSI
jgi:NAD dependent epimerase/dehydratase